MQTAVIMESDITTIRILNCLTHLSDMKAPGRPKLTWEETVKRDRAKLGMERINPQDRQAWRGRLRSRLDSQAAPSSED
jgi:hypothetical protein